MKVESKTTIELDGEDAKKFKSAIDKIAKAPNAIGLKAGNDHNLTTEEKDLLIKINTELK